LVLFGLTEVVLKDTNPGFRVHLSLSIAIGILASAAAMAEGLIVQANGTLYDSNQNVTRLADANFAEGEAVLKAARIASIAPSGIMVLGLRYPSSVAPRFQDSVARFLNLDPALSWSATEGGQTANRLLRF
jgi:hypothetical protein